MASSEPALGLRTLSALVLAPVALGALWLGLWPFSVLVALALGLMAVEWRGLLAARAGGPAGTLAGAAAMTVGLAVVALTALGLPGVAGMVLVAGALAAAGVAWWLVAAPLWTALGVVYLGLPALALIWLRSDPPWGAGALLWLLVVVWATDILAYFVGRGLGGPRLAPMISPGKTWSGLCGGVVGAALVGGAAAALGGAGRYLPAAALAAVLALVAQAGDLFESGLKRRAHLKDSGHVIPGHGGVLDRLDGLLFAAPTLALLGWWLGPGGLPWL